MPLLAGGGLQHSDLLKLITELVWSQTGFLALGFSKVDF